VCTTSIIRRKDEKQKAFSSFVPSALGEIRRATVDGL